MFLYAMIGGRKTPFSEPELPSLVHTLESAILSIFCF